MFWTILLPYCVTFVLGNKTDERIPFFHGHVFENSPPGSKVNGLSIPVKRVDPQRWCSKSGMHLKLLGDRSEDFHVFAHHKRGHILLKTSSVLDREERAEYFLSLALCCQSCASAERIVAEVASIKVDVLDTNDHEPTFQHADVKITLDDATALRSVVYTVKAEDIDSGKNAELIYYALPRNGSFYVVPKTGDILLVDSILGLAQPIKFSVFARDHGWPSRTSQNMDIEISPRQWPALPQLEDGLSRKSRSVPEPVLITVSEDASIGSVIMNLHPVRFQSASFELAHPDADNSPVTVSRDSGDLVISRRLDRETQPLVEITVKVQDKRGPDWYTVRVDLTVMDVNDNAPEWTMVPFPYLSVVSAISPPNTLVYKLQARDGDEGINGEVEYFLSDGGDGRFEVDRKNGHVRTTGLPLQRDREYLLTVVAADRQGSRSPPAVLSIIAGPRAPQFTNVSYTIPIPENTPEGQPFLVTPAVSFQKQPVTYSLLINPSSLFSIQPETGEISLTRTIDYESDQHRYLLLVRASENQDSLSSAAEVRVIITDENDCVPEFLQSIYSKDGVPETVTTATSLLQVSASDCDSEQNAEITYYTLSPDFIISAHGTIFPAGPLDYERQNHLYEFVVMAVDKGEVPRTGTATVRLRMANVNDEPPEFSQPVYRTFVSEDAGPNTLVATVLAKDPDGDGITYKITAGNDEGNFVIDSQKGLIRLRSSPSPRLQGLKYMLNVTATDDNASGGPQSLSAVAQVIVGVDDVNNNKPVFEKCAEYKEKASVLENKPAGSFVLQVHADDADEGANGKVTYGFMHKDSTVPAFSIDPETGVIGTAIKFDRESQREYAVTVTATDQAADPLIGICQLNILILDENDNNPKFENLRYEYFLREDTMIGTSFLRVAAHDDDYSTNAAISYSMSEEQPEYLQVNPLTGWVYVNQPISQRTYISRQIIATDGGNRSSSVELAVTITNVKNQPPQWEKDKYEVVIPENTVRDTPVVTIKATSPLGDPRVTYNLEDGLVPESNMPVRFYLTPNREDGSASILVAEPLDYETTRNFMLRVRAQNVAPVPLAAFTTVHINITDVNDNVPFFTSSIYEASVTEGVEIGTLVLQVSANDLDLGLNGKISYSLLNDRSGDFQYFRIDPELGTIFTEAVFDRETKGSYLLEVKSVDGWESARPGKHGQPNSDTAYVRIFISDVNDNKPVFAQPVYEVDVDEDADVGSTVLTVSANDEDEGANAKLRYQITSGNVGGVFDMEPEVGTIFIAQPLDYEQNKLYKLHVLASDGKWEDYATVIVTIVNKNDEAPVFSVNEYYGSVTEELDGSPVFVLQVTASDPDKDADQEALRYSLHGQGAESEFIIDEVTGKIYAQRTLDREVRAVWRFVVLATDEGGEGLTGFTDVIINVWDINDNAPIFACAPDSCHGDVAENSPPGTSVMEMTATDLDDAAVGQNAMLAYRIVGNAAFNGANSGADMFNINPATGTVSVSMSGLDREQIDSYVLVVEARDGGGMIGSATATIHVTDVNDHIPRFLDRSCFVRIPESSEPNTAVIELAAEDADAGENGQLTFSVVAGDPEQKFYMVSHRQEQRGTLRLKKRLDYEKPGEQRFNLTIKVEDMQYSTLLHCALEIEDCNDHVPVFIPHFLQLPAIREDVAPGTSLASVAASDLDSGLNREITYTIAAESDPYHLFSVDQSGLVTVASELDREKVAQHHLVILAADHGTPPLTGTATIQMALLDVNDNGPEFEAAYAPVVWENVLGPQVVRLNQTSMLLRAVDRDSEENGSPFSFFVPLEYRYSNDFHLQDNGNDTATITALRAFDRERQKEFLLPVIMTDSGSPPKTVTNTLTITIGDENDHAHTAGQKKVFINCHRGRMPTNVLGKVYSPDPDDWDNKTYAFEGHVPNYFILNKRTGFLIIKENAPPGSYEFQVRVSDGVWPDAVSSVKVNVRELRDDAIYNSASLRLADISAPEFMERRGNLKSRYELLGDFLSDMLSVGVDDINIFSLMEVRDRTLDVRFSVHSTPFIRAERVHGYLAAHKQKLQSFLQVNVTQVHVDECVDADCRGGGGCTSHLSVTDKPAVVDSGSMALVSVTVEATAVCSCSAREHLHQSCSIYPRNPCHNGGVCVDTQSGYRCQCPAQFEGPECQQTKHSFHGNGYAWFPPIRPCFESHLSLEFITEVADGLLLYSGPLSQLQPWEPEDFMAIELIDGTPTLKINHGSGTLVLQLPGNVNVADRRWHRLDVRSNSKEVRFTLDRCAGATIMEMEGVGSWLTTEDHTSCEVTGITPNMDKHLNVTQVLQLGGVNENLPYIYPQLQHKHFTGCIRNLIVDSKYYDLGSPADSSGSAPGCVMTDSSCVNMGFPSCGTRGRCHGEWGSFSCQCIPGYSGHQCEKEVPEYSFDGRSHIHFQLAFTLPARHTQVQVLVRTRKRSSSILSLLSKEQNEYLRLEIYQGLLSVFYNLGDGDFNLTMPSYRLDNGEWHDIHLDRHDNELTLRLDGGGGRREVTGSPGRSREIVIDPAVVMLGNSFPSGHNRSFQGCMRDLRLNGRFIALDSQARDGVSVVSSQGVSLGCFSDSCRKNLCSPPFTCVDLWRVHECRCPTGHMVKVNSTGKFCVYTMCASRPCHKGTCVAQSPSKFTCHCPEGYRGRHCEVTLAIYRDDVGLSFSSLFAICICFMALLVLLLGIFLYTRWRSYKGLKEGVYHVSAHHDGWEDIRENVLNYDEEGGGEEDQNAYDMAELQKSLQPSPAQSVQYSRSRAIHHHPPSQQQQQHFCQPDPPSRAGTATTTTSSISSGSATIRRDVPPCRSPAQGQTANPSRAAQLARKSLSFSSQDLARYLCEIIRDADQHPETAPFDSLQVFSTEGGGSLAGSLSSFSSAGLEEGMAAGHECLKEWGPRFEKLKALYERAEGSDL
ncbi:LOW QUALITY PROTEIN: neural-cadherin [Danio aesculapii]|uniref:LOW QUALITY PROTEIN: neural-cadherin n=1 Tax=Danio aesculapii TaxID=1142201 RepID=UPI0024C00201|nr:LOW QUALITY PROTEIN: neural-cadherin [Danio aesculapii]